MLFAHKRVGNFMQQRIMNLFVGHVPGVIVGHCDDVFIVLTTAGPPRSIIELKTPVRQPMLPKQALGLFGNVAQDVFMLLRSARSLFAGDALRRQPFIGNLKFLIIVADDMGAFGIQASDDAPAGVLLNAEFDPVVDVKLQPQFFHSAVYALLRRMGDLREQGIRYSTFAAVVADNIGILSSLFLNVAEVLAITMFERYAISDGNVGRMGNRYDLFHSLVVQAMPCSRL